MEMTSETVSATDDEAEAEVETAEVEELVAKENPRITETKIAMTAKKNTRNLRLLNPSKYTPPPVTH